ncbi:MAG TPA: peptide MFS transporter [Bryobacteraceae bacterium]|jgi:POT family proton-dependent oligopeptide transporter
MATQISPREDTSFFGHPRGLATLFFTEMWERFSYYGQRAILILYMTAPLAGGGLGFAVPKAGAIYGLYTALAYLASLPGGWVADRYIGQRRAVLYGGILIAAGEFCLVAPGLAMFYAGLGVIIVGTGLLKSNASTIVGQLYAPGDKRRDSGFSIFYMGINIGALISPLACGWVAERIAWRLGYALAGVGMVAGVIQYVIGYKHLGTAGLYPPGRDAARGSQRKSRAGWWGAAALLIVAAVALAKSGVSISAESISNAFGVVLVVVCVGVFSWLIFGRGWSPAERKRSVAILVLFIASTLFWFAFEQAGSTLNLFAEKSTNRNVLGFLYPASWMQFVQPLFVISLAPVFAWLWIALRHREPSSPAKFSIGLIFVSLSFAILVPAAKINESGVLVSSWWLIGTYFLQTLGELSLSPVGLSAMTKLAPERVAGLMMGVWFLSISIGDYLAGRAASLYESLTVPALFGQVALYTFIAAIVMALLIKPTVRLMGGVK